MACVHEFGILDEIGRRKDYNEYEPHKYNCIPVDDDLINPLLPRLSKMKTYFHSLDRPAYGLAYCGITIIPPESLPLFYDAVTSSASAGELQKLASIILQAREQNKHLIHYGI